MEPVVLNIYLWGRFVGAMSWDENAGYADFEYDPQFRRTGWDIAP